MHDRAKPRTLAMEVGPVAWAMPVWQRWTPSRVALAAFGLVLTFLVGLAMGLAGWGSWCSTIGFAIVDDRLVELDWGSVTRGMLLQYGGMALFAIPWGLLAMLRRHHDLETAAYIIVTALLLLWSEELFRSAVADPLTAERVQCWHF